MILDFPELTESLDSPPPLTPEEVALYRELLAEAEALELELARFELERLVWDEYYHCCGKW
jgi:hypothetical protein